MITPWKITKEGIELFVKLSPNASKDQILGLIQDGNEHCYLKVSVTAIAENGKANQALVELLSKKLRIAKSKVRVKSGMKSTRKVVVLDDVTEELLIKGVISSADVS